MSVSRKTVDVFLAEVVERLISGEVDSKKLGMFNTACTQLLDYH